MNPVQHKELIRDLNKTHIGLSTYLPHGHKIVSEEMDVDLARHLRRLLHVHIVVEEVLEGGHFAEWLKLVTIALCLLRRGLLNPRLRPDPRNPLYRLLLLLRVEGCLSLVVPELPRSLALMAILR